MVSRGRRATDGGTSDDRGASIHRLENAPRHPDVDVVFYSTTEGGYQGYAALVSQAEHELFLWHVVEIVRVNKDRSVKFPDKVKVPTLSLTSLIKFGGCAETPNNEDRG